MTNTEQRVTEAMAARAINWHAEQARTSAARMAAERSAVARIRYHAEASSPAHVSVAVTVSSVPDRGAA
jgi:hypothetical protein